MIQWKERARYLHIGCGSCDYEEADGSLIHYCAKCTHAIYGLLYEIAAAPAREPVAWMYWDRMAGEYDVRVGKDEPNVVGATPLYAAPAPPTNPSDARDAQRYRWLREQSHPWGKVWYSREALDKRIDNAISALAAQGGKE